MRKNANSQNRQSKITDAIATPPSEAASPSRPIAVVETMPISGVVRLATIAGPAMANTCAVVTLVGRVDGEVSMPGLRHCEERSDEAIQSHTYLRLWIASRSLSSGRP